MEERSLNEIEVRITMNDVCNGHDHPPTSQDRASISAQMQGCEGGRVKSFAAGREAL
jgi:hypothetical protein